MKRSLTMIETLATLALAGAAPAWADVVYDFSGTCSGCSQPATAELTLTSSYALGQTIKASNFVSFHYDGTGGGPAFTISADSGLYITLSGAVSAVPGANDVIVDLGSIHDFRTYGDNWYADTDRGVDPTWSAAAPEPATWAMMAAGFAALGLAGYRARRPLAQA